MVHDADAFEKIEADHLRYSQNSYLHIKNDLQSLRTSVGEVSSSQMRLVTLEDAFANAGDIQLVGVEERSLLPQKSINRLFRGLRIHQFIYRGQDGKPIEILKTDPVAPGFGAIKLSYQS
ncbi:uncharacterized protein ARMOST_15978 [Armillaria ostoyae]|uniref:Uncharacterized protein n=1 Tax=Armillaria ostoyae TaxID=47428 RepID=A0A284RUY4_ARMOS|nr:uncharacterized protein ARMOST_15978 [Armillaria ostoyae]